MPHEMHELVEPSLAIVDGLARVVFLLGVVGVEEAADARMARAIDVKQLAVASYTAPPPDVDLGLGVEFTRRQLDRRRKPFACVFESTPVHGDLSPRCGSVKFRLPLISNRFLMPSKSKKNASLRLPAKKV